MQWGVSAGHIAQPNKLQLEAQIKKDKQKQRQLDRDRLMGVKKVETIPEGRKKIDKQRLEKLVGPLIEKHLADKLAKKMKMEDRDWDPIPQKWTEDEQEFLESLETGDGEPELMKQEKGETDDDFWERKALSMLPKYDYLNPALQRAKKPGRDYRKIADKVLLESWGDPDKIPYYMRYPDQPKELFRDEKTDILEPTTLEDVKDHEMVITKYDKRDGRDYANNIQQMYNRVHKWKLQTRLEHEAMGVKPFVPPVQNSKYKDKFKIRAAVILERYPTLTPDFKPFELEHEEWEQNIRLQTCKPVIPWYIWKLEWERLNEVQTKANQNKPAGKASSFTRTGKQPSKREESKDKRLVSKGAGDLDIISAKPPDWGLPKIQLPELSPEDALEQQKSEARKLKPYKDWIEFWKNWEAAPRRTKDDEKNNRKSSDRELDKKLYLIVRRKQEKDWVFPVTDTKDDETIRTSAERGIRDAVGKLTVYFHSNAPVGFYNSYFRTEQEQDKHQLESEKIFYMRARYFNGQPDAMRRHGYNNFLWVTRDQLSEYFDKDYFDRVINFIWPDPNYELIDYSKYDQ